MTTHASPADPTTVAARVAQLPHLSMDSLWALWDEYFEERPKHHHRTWLESRLAYRIQELAYGGLKPETLARLEALGEQLDGGTVTVRRMRGDDKPIAGTQLIREYQGVEYVVTVTRAGYEYGGQPYQSLSAIARAITGTRWNGRVFFGLRPSRSAA